MDIEQVGSDAGTQSDVVEAAPVTSTQETSSSQSEIPQYEKGVSLSEKLSQSNQKAVQKEIDNITDLSKLEKFRWNGKVLTAKELEKMAMFQSDYTKKTQSIAEQRKYQENLAYDLENIKNNPSLVDAFKRIYPKEYHKFVDFVVNAAETSQGANKTTNGQANASMSSAEEKPEAQSKPDPRLEELYNHYQETQQQAATEKINALFDRCNQKYPDADEGKIIAKVQSLYELAQRDGRYSRPSEKDIENMFKVEHEKYNNTLKERLSKMIAEQKKANVKGAAPLAGGGVPGKAPASPRTLKEATSLALSDPNFS